MWKKIAIISLTLWVISISIFGYMFIKGTGKVVDDRVEITLSKSDRNLVLGEMRQLLIGLQNILRGLAQNDFKAVQLAAKSNGMAMAVDPSPTLMAKLPMELKTIGMGVHKSFDELAANADKMTVQQVLKETTEIMDSCVACHATYKIIEK